MNINSMNRSRKEHNPTDSGEINDAQSRELAPISGARLNVLNAFMGRMNYAAQTRQNQLFTAGGALIANKPAQTVNTLPTYPAYTPAQQPMTAASVEQEPLLDDTLAYAAFQPQDHLVEYNPVAEAEAIALRATADDARQKINALPSEFDEPVEVGIAGPTVDPTVTYMSNLSQAMAAPAVAAEGLYAEPAGRPQPTQPMPQALEVQADQYRLAA